MDGLLEEGAGAAAGVAEVEPAAGSLDLDASLDSEALDSAGLDSPEDSDEESELLEA